MAEWSKTQLSDILVDKGYIRGPFGSALKRGDMKENGVPVYEQQHAIYDSRCFRYYIDEQKFVEMKRFQVNTDDLIISCSGTVGKVSIIRDDDPKGIISQALLLLRVDKNKILPLYLKYFFSSRDGYNAIVSRSSGSVQVNIAKRDVIEQIPLMLPKIETQRKIVGVLNSIDKKIDENERINNNLEQQAQAVYYKMFSEVNTVPVELSSIIDVRDGTHDSPKAQATGYYLITSKHLLPFGVDKASANRISKADFDKINERSLVETQDILMSMIGTIGLISYIPYETVDFAIKNVALFKTSHTPELAYYFLCYLKSEKTLQHIGKCLAGSTQKYISLGELRKMPIYSPTTNEIREFNCLVKPMFEKIVSRTYENALLAEMRDSLLPKLMSGELDVSKIDI